MTLAVVASSPGPLLLLDGDLNIVAASASFCTAFGIDPTAVRGRRLASLGAGEWAAPTLGSLLNATLAGAAEVEAYEFDLKRPGRPHRQLVIHAQRLAYLDLDETRLLVGIVDVTDIRADAKVKDDALRQNLILLQEVRHRVANSLQIIASVLLQNARQTQSDETRGHLKDAHSRVMSVAALERLLSASGDADVDLRVYFTALCESISASMIGDSNRLQLAVTGPGGMIEARISVSLGLILTELVINALKHAFPESRSGRVVVDCSVDSAGWRLSVTDDGVGMPTDPLLTRSGLGSSIVQALAQQLEATLDVSSARPGARTVIEHLNAGSASLPMADAESVRSPAA